MGLGFKTGLVVVVKKGLRNGLGLVFPKTFGLEIERNDLSLKPDNFGLKLEDPTCPLLLLFVHF